MRRVWYSTPNVVRAPLDRRFTIGRANNPPTAKTQQTLTVPQNRAIAAANPKQPGPAVIARGSTTVPANKTVSLAAKLTSVGAHLLRKRKALEATLTVIATGATGNAQKVKKKIMLLLR